MDDPWEDPLVRRLVLCTILLTMLITAAMWFMESVRPDDDDQSRCEQQKVQNHESQHPR